MGDDTDSIRNLLHRYAELIDAGDLAGVGALFDHARVDWGGDTTTGGQAVTDRLSSATRLYADGTPRTAHVITNSIIEIDRDSATARSRYTVFRAVDTQPLQAIICGRYHDDFTRVYGTWRFSSRRYLVDLVGDLSAHLPPDMVRRVTPPAD